MGYRAWHHLVSLPLGSECVGKKRARVRYACEILRALGAAVWVTAKLGAGQGDGGGQGVCHQAYLLPLLARNCMRLQVLELDHVSEITQEVAAEVCREGLKGLEMLVLTATPVTPKALLHFNSEQWGFRVAGHGYSLSSDSLQH